MSLEQFKLSYEISPIILNGGIAGQVPGGMIPIISLVQPQDFNKGLLSASQQMNPDDFVAHFEPVSGSTLLDLQLGAYPFANQRVAANAVIFQPLRVSLMMVAPAPTQGGYNQKLAAFSSLQNQLQQHALQGGTYTVATPSFLYSDLILTSLRDISSGGDGAQVQTRWQWDFVKPLLTQAEAVAAQNQLMSKMSNGTQVTGDPPSYSGASTSVGQPSSGVGPPLIPAAQSTTGSSVGGPETGTEGFNPSAAG